MIKLHPLRDVLNIEIVDMEKQKKDIISLTKLSENIL